MPLETAKLMLWMPPCSIEVQCLYHRACHELPGVLSKGVAANTEAREEVM